MAGQMTSNIQSTDKPGISTDHPGFSLDNPGLSHENPRFQR